MHRVRRAHHHTCENNRCVCGIFGSGKVYKSNFMVRWYVHTTDAHKPAPTRPLTHCLRTIRLIFDQLKRKAMKRWQGHKFCFCNFHDCMRRGDSVFIAICYLFEYWQIYWLFNTKPWTRVRWWVCGWRFSFLSSCQNSVTWGKSSSFFGLDVAK